MSCDGDDGEMGWVVVGDDGGMGGWIEICMCVYDKVLIRLFFRFAICRAFHYSVQGYMKTYKVLYIKGSFDYSPSQSSIVSLLLRHTSVTAWA